MAQKFIAPGIKRVEVDQSEIVAAASTSIGGLVGQVSKGPANTRVLLTNDKEFYQTFGTPISGLSSENVYYAAGEFLKESNQLWFVRTTNTELKYSHRVFNTGATQNTSAISQGISAVSTTTLLTKSGFADGNKPDDIYDLEDGKPSTGSSDTAFVLNSFSPGSDGDNIGVAVITSASAEGEIQGFYDWKYKFDEPSSTTGNAPTPSTNTIYDKVYKIKVYVKPDEQDESWFNTSPQSISATPVEEFLVSNYPNLKDKNGASLYAPNVINGKSNYIYISHVTNNAYPAPMTSVSGLSGGQDSTTTHTPAIKKSGWELFNDKEKVDVRILIVPEEPADSTDVSIITSVGNIASTRQDCISVGQVGGTDERTATSIVSFRNDNTYAFYNPSYTALYGGYTKYYDNFTDKIINIPNAIFGAKLMARTDRVANTWDAPAGVNRGIIGSSLGQYRVYNEAEIGYMYDNNINCVKSIRGVGDVMWGQKTAQRKSSALDRINVRRLFIFLENSLENALVPFLFEANTDKTRNRVFSIIDGFMSTVQAGGGVTAYQVTVDETNNPSDVIDNNQLNIDLLVQPTRTIEYIQLRVTVTRTGVQFS